MQWTDKGEPMKRPALKPMGWEPQQSGKFARYTARLLLFLLIVSLTFVLSGCSKAVSITPMPAPPANLASDCPTLESLPSPFLDPERLIWEMGVLNAYADCAAKHRMTVDAWQQAIDRD